MFFSSASPKLLRKTEEEDEGLSGFMREGMLTPKHDTGAGRRGEEGGGRRAVG